MLKQTFIIILLTIFLIQSSSKIVIVSMWWLKRDYIAKNLCINRLKPSLHCNGKCFLMKKLKEAEQKQRDQMPDLKNFQETFLIRPEIVFLPSMEICFPEVNEIPVDFEFSPSQSHLQKIFNPPEVS